MAVRSLPILIAILTLPLMACTTTNTETESKASTAMTTVPSCEPIANARPICGFKNPEDMVALPGNKAILIGGYGQSGQGEAGAGKLTILDLANETRRTAYVGGRDVPQAEPGWGDPACRTSPTSAFNSHGIDLVRRNNGRLALLVVQHGGREAIEFFEILGSGTRWRVIWRGCVLAPADASLNDVVALPDGRFYTTKMMSLGGALDFEAGLPTQPTGHVYSWSLEDGYRVIPGTEGIFPNGLEASPDGLILYMNVSGENRIRKIEVATGRALGHADVETPDNVTWGPDGKLLVASLSAFSGEGLEACQGLEAVACPMPFKIIAVDPENMTTLGAIYESDGQPMGAGTVGLQVGDELFVGSFQGDRILRVSLDE